MEFKHKRQNKKKGKRNLLIYLVLVIVVIALYIALSYYENQAEQNKVDQKDSNESELVE